MTPRGSTHPDRSLRRAARGSVLNLTGSAFAALAMFMMSVAITRLSTRDHAGVFFTATSIFLIAINVGRLGTNTGLVYFISGSRGRGELGTSRPYMRIASGPVAAVALVSTALLLVLAGPLATWVSWDDAGMVTAILRTLAVLIPFAAAANLAMAASQGLGTMKVYASIDQVMLPVLQLTLVSVVLLTGPWWAVPVAWAAAYIPVAIVGWLWWRRLADRLDPISEPLPHPSPSAFWKFTTPRAMASVSQIAMQRLDIVLVGALATVGGAAVYAAATRFLVLGQLVGRSISLSIQPLLAGTLARGNLDETKRLYQTCTAWLVMLTWPLYLCLIGLAPQVLGIFGTGYEVGGSALVLLCGAMLLATATGAVDIVLTMAGKSWWNLINVLVALAVFLVVDLWLIPSMGFMGAAVGWSAAIVVANLLPLVQILHTLGVHPFGRAALFVMGLNVGCFTLLPWLATRLGDGSSPYFAVGAGVGLAFYLLSLVLARRLLRLGMLARALRRGRGRGRAVWDGPST